MEFSFDELVSQLCNGISQCKLYFNSHPKVFGCAKEFAGHLKTYLEKSNKESFFLGVVDDNLVHDGRYLVGPTILGKRLIEFVKNLNSGGLLFKSGVTPSELCQFFSLAAELIDPAESLEFARSMLSAKGVENIEISPVYEDPRWFGQFFFDKEEVWGGDEGGAVGNASIIRAHQSLYDTVEVAHCNAGCDQAVDLAGAQTAAEKMMGACDTGFMDIMQLVRYPNYDSYTVGHSVRVAMIAVLVGQTMGLDKEFLLEFGVAGLLHDIGKSKISEEILFKPGKLDKEEWQVIITHPSLGAQILLENPKAGPLAVACAWGHHLRHDRKGYPPIPEWAVMQKPTELMHVCDVFEALTAVRPYKKAMTPRRAYEIMFEDPNEFDPEMLAAFVRAMGLYPPGSRVALSNGEQGVVIAAGQDVQRPKVKVTHSVEQDVLAPEDVKVVNLSEPASRDLSVRGLLEDASPDKSPVLSVK